MIPNNSEHIKKALQWYLGFRLPPYSNNSVFNQKIRAKNASEFEQNFGVQTLGLETKKSRLESKRTPRSISWERKEPSRAKTHSEDRFVIKEKRKATAQPNSPPKKREREGKKSLKESYPASFRYSMLFRYTFSQYFRYFSFG